MALAITVSPGIVLPLNRPLTVEDLQLLGLPVIAIAGSVGGSDVAAGGINATHIKPGPICVGSATGTTTLTVSLSPAPSAHASGVWFWVIPASTTTGALTVVVNALASKSLVRCDGRECLPGDVVAGRPSLVAYDATLDKYILLNPARGENLYATAGGTANALTLTLPITGATLSSLVGVPFWCKVSVTNTGAVTLAVNGTAATAVRSPEGRPLYSGELLADTYVMLMYDGTYYRLLAGGQTTTTAAQSGTTLDWALARHQYRVLDANLTFNAFANADEGREVTIWIKQAASGGPYTVSWDAGLAIKWQGATAPSMVTTASRANAYSFVKVNGEVRGVVSSNHG